jgi:hypothetical protein
MTTRAPQGLGYINGQAAPQGTQDGYNGAQTALTPARFSSIAYKTVYDVAMASGTCGVCGQSFTRSTELLVTVSSHTWGSFVHTRAHVRCPVELPRVEAA